MLGELFSDLALQAAPRIRVNYRGDDRRPLRIRVAGQPCPVRWYDADPAVEPADIALPRRVVASLHANVDLLITADVARRAAASAGGMAERLGTEEWTTLLRSLVERGTRMDGTASFSSPEGHPGDAAAVMGALLRDLGATRVELALGAQLYQLLVRERGAKTLRMLADGIFFECGVYLPKPELLLDWDLGENEFRLRVNDCREVPQQGLAQTNPGQRTSGRASGTGVPGSSLSKPLQPAEPDGVALQLRTRLPTGRVYDVGRWGLCCPEDGAMLRDRLGDLLTPAVAELALTQLETAFPEMIRTLRTRVGLDTFTSILRELVDSGIAARDIQAIGESILAIQSTYTVAADAGLFTAARSGGEWQAAGRPASSNSQIT